jgi:serine/threonine protein kinase
MNQQPNPTTYGRESQIVRESIGGSPELTLAVGNYRNYLNRLLGRIKDPKGVKVDEKVIIKAVSETTRHLGTVLEVVRSPSVNVNFAHYLEIVKAYLIVTVAFLGQKTNMTQYLPESKETTQFTDLLMQFSLSPEQTHRLAPHVANLKAQQQSLEALLRPMLPKFQQMIAASRQEITDVIRPVMAGTAGGSAVYEATTDRIHESTVVSRKKNGKPTKAGTKQFTELNPPGIKDDAEASQLQIEFLPESGKVEQGVMTKAPQAADKKMVNLLEQEGFKLVKKLGEGGMGVVYLAGDTKLGGALVAIKRILRQPGTDQEEWDDLTGRFRREGIAMAELTWQYPKGFTPINRSFEIDGDPCIVMKCEQGPSEGVSDEAISKAITNGRRVFEFSRAKEWYLELEGFVAGHAYSISVDSVLHLADLALQSKIVKKGTKEFEILTHIKRKQYPGNEMTKDQLPTEVLESAVRLKEVIEKHFFPVPVDEVMHYVKISKLHEGVTDGDKTMKVVKHLREYCGDNFPQDVYVKIWMLLSKDFLGTIRFMHEQGYINRDIKPSNLILTSEAASILFQLLDDVILLSPADKDVKQEKVRAVFERALQKMKELDQSEEGTGLVKLIDLGLAKKIEPGKKTPVQKKKKVEDESPLDPYMTQAGTVMGTPAFMTRAALMNSENESVDGDYHAAALTILALLKGEEVANLGKNHIGIGINLDTWSEEADKARTAGAKPVDTESSIVKNISRSISKYLPKKEESKAPVALSVAEKDPTLFAYLVEHHPVLASWVQSATWLTKFKHQIEIDWEGACDYMNDQLYPAENSKRNVGLGVAITLAIATVLGGAGYKVQSDRNAIAVQQKALEEKMNAIRLRVAQTQEMAEGTIEEMEAKIATISQTIQFMNSQKELHASLNVDNELRELNLSLDLISNRLMNAMIHDVEEKLTNFDVDNVGEDYFQIIYDQMTRVKKMNVTSRNNQHIALVEKKIELLNLGWCLSMEYKKYIFFPIQGRETNPQAQLVFRNAVTFARRFVDLYLQLPHRTQFANTGLIPDDKIVPSTNNYLVNNYGREIFAMPFPKNYRMASEYIQRVVPISQDMVLDENTTMLLFGHSLFRMIRWLESSSYQKLHSYPTEIQQNNLVDDLLGATEASLLMLKEYNEALDSICEPNQWGALLSLRQQTDKTEAETSGLTALERLNEINHVNLQVVLNYLKLLYLKSKSK